MSVEVIFCTDCRAILTLDQDYAGILCRACATRYNKDVCHGCRGHGQVHRLVSNEFGEVIVYQAEICEDCLGVGMFKPST